MKCPVCGCPDTKVTDSRSAEDDLKVRRRRECSRCGYRFTTYEVIESSPLMVAKRDGSRQPFDREKLLRGPMRACNKRSLSMQNLDAMVGPVGTAAPGSGLPGGHRPAVGGIGAEKTQEAGRGGLHPFCFGVPGFPGCGQPWSGSWNGSGKSRRKRTEREERECGSATATTCTAGAGAETDFRRGGSPL